MNLVTAERTTARDRALLVFMIGLLEFIEVGNGSMHFLFWNAFFFELGSGSKHFLFWHAFFFTPDPPKHFISRHSWHWPQFGFLQQVHSPQRLLERFRLNPTATIVSIIMVYVLCSHSITITFHQCLCLAFCNRSRPWRHQFLLECKLAQSCSIYVM